MPRRLADGTIKGNLQSKHSKSGCSACDIVFQHLALVIHGTPKIMRLAINLHKYLIQMPLPVRVCAHLLNSFAADFSGEHRAKSISPLSNRFMADVDAALVQKALDITERQRKTDVQHYRQADHLTARFKIPKWIRFGHPARLGNRPAQLKRFCVIMPKRRGCPLLFILLPPALGQAVRRNQRASRLAGVLRGPFCAPVFSTRLTRASLLLASAAIAPPARTVSPG